ncbi:MAG TPA: EMC3/TMCO1 family protein [Conexivisphaerales archaeon]|nr:EMC3/TMCO1 family protein [Conexivisphaerales archaeon]
MTTIPWYQTIPDVTLLVLGVSIVLSLVTNYVTKRKVDIKAERLVRIESNEAMKEYREAMKSGDQKKIDKAKRQQKLAQDKMLKTSSVRMKVQMYFMIPLFAVLTVLGIVVGYGTNTAVSPYVFDLLNFHYLVAKAIPNNSLSLGFMNFITWYFVVSFVSNLVIARAMGTNP